MEKKLDALSKEEKKELLEIVTTALILKSATTLTLNEYAKITGVSVKRIIRWGKKKISKIL